LIPAAAAAAAAAACVLTACGGGSAGAPPGAATGSGGTPTPTATTGVAVDGYLQGATALCDANGNGVADTGEATVATTAEGRFTFAAGCNAVVVVSGGTNVDTGLPFKGVLKAPAGATVASPLTTLLVAGMTAAQVNAAMGLPAATDLLNTDPAARVNGNLVNADLMKASAAVQQLLQKTAEVFTGLAGGSTDAAQSAAYTEVASAFAGALTGGAKLSSGAVLDATVVGSLVKAATQRVGTSASVAPAVKAAAAAVNADTLSQVLAGALKAQGDAILAAPAAGLTDVTKTAATDTAIGSFVAANGSQLAAAPSAATATLAGSLTAQVGAVLAAAPSTYLAIAGDAISLVNGSATTSFTMAQFQSDAGIQVSWPLPSPIVLKVAVNDVGGVAIADGQKLTAAVAVSETTATGQGKVLGFIDSIAVSKSGNGLQIAIPASGAQSLVYGMSSDGKKQAVVDFASSVAGVANTLSLAANSSNSILLGSVVNYAINQVSNDFTGIYSLRGKYKVTVVLNGLALRKADGTALPALTLRVPTALDASGAVTAGRSVSGVGLVGYITLTN
jgi:hypothetical protein